MDIDARKNTVISTYLRECQVPKTLPGEPARTRADNIPLHMVCWVPRLWRSTALSSLTPKLATLSSSPSARSALVGFHPVYPSLITIRTPSAPPSTRPSIINGWNDVYQLIVWTDSPSQSSITICNFWLREKAIVNLRYSFRSLGTSPRLHPTCLATPPAKLARPTPSVRIFPSLAMIEPTSDAGYNRAPHLHRERWRARLPLSRYPALRQVCCLFLMGFDEEVDGWVRIANRRLFLT